MLGAAGCGGSGDEDASGATEFTFSFGPDNSGPPAAAISARRHPPPGSPVPEVPAPLNSG